MKHNSNKGKQNPKTSKSTPKGPPPSPKSPQQNTRIEFEVHSQEAEYAMRYTAHLLPNSPEYYLFNFGKDWGKKTPQLELGTPRGQDITLTFPEGQDSQLTLHHQKVGETIVGTMTRGTQMYRFWISCSYSSKNNSDGGEKSQ